MGASFGDDTKITRHCGSKIKANPHPPKASPIGEGKNPRKIAQVVVIHSKQTSIKHSLLSVLQNFA
jgi:hypothetical protein